MGLFGKKKVSPADILAEDRAVIQKNLVAVNRLKISLETNADTCAKLNEIASDYEFVSPKGAEEILNIDKRIGTYLDDIELIAKRSERNRDFTEIDGLIRKIRIAVAER